jgi:3-oxoacyl-[acyl-carrier-protein] synthase II
MTLGDACAAGGMAIGSAMRHIRHGELDVALAGAAEAMCNYVPMVGFGILGALCGELSGPPHTLSRPFDKDRSGFIMGEGSAFLVLESEEHARRRGAAVLARVSGFARQAEAWRMTSSPAGGASYARCMRAALDDAGLAPKDIDHVNAHGTSTVNNDACEAAAIRSVYGERAEQLPVTSNKSALGHSLAASGALEAVLSVLSLARQQLLPTLNFREADAATAGIAVVRETRAAALRHVASHSFGFGGENCVLVFSR